MKTNQDKAVADFKKIFPDFTDICNNWLSIAKVHGHVQSRAEIKTLGKFTKIMDLLGVREND